MHYVVFQEQACGIKSAVAGGILYIKGRHISFMEQCASGAEWLSPCRTLILDHTVDWEAAKLHLLCLNNLFSLVKEV